MFIMPWYAPVGGMLCWLILAAMVYKFIQTIVYKLMLAKALSIHNGASISQSITSLYHELSYPNICNNILENNRNHDRQFLDSRINATKIKNLKQNLNEIKSEINAL